jgi:hypothetical protein
VFIQNALQRSAMHLQSPRGFRNITITLFKDALNVFPPDAVSRHWIVRWRWQRPFGFEQSGG